MGGLLHQVLFVRNLMCMVHNDDHYLHVHILHMKVKGRHGAAGKPVLE